MRMPKKPKLIPVASKLDEELIEQTKLKMKLDKKKGYKITWRQIFEQAMTDYIEEKTLPTRKAI